MLYTKTKESDDISAIFVSKLEKITNKIYQDFYCRPLPLKLTQSEQKSFIKQKSVIFVRRNY